MNIQNKLSRLLDVLGFYIEAEAVLTETDNNRIRQYARMVLRNWPKDQGHKEVARGLQGVV